MNQLKRICNYGNPKPNLRRIKPIRLSELLGFCVVCMITSQCWPCYQPLFHCSPSTCCKKVAACVFFWRSSFLLPLVCLLLLLLCVCVCVCLSLSLSLFRGISHLHLQIDFRAIPTTTFLLWMLIFHKWLSHW